MRKDSRNLNAFLVLRGHRITDNSEYSGKRQSEATGQSIVEFALVLPFLLLLILGIADLGYAFYDYIEVVGANREGIRLASRGQRFDDTVVAERIVNSGGVDEPEPGVRVPRFRTSGGDANFGIIITHFPIDEDGDLDMGDVTTYVTGTLSSEAGTRSILASDTRLEGDFEGFHGDITGKINDRRIAEGYDTSGTEIVMVETFYAHDPFFPVFMDLLQMEDPLTLYVSSAMRVLEDSRSQQGD